jgi:Stress responsive A/B Barrel Domain
MTDMLKHIVLFKLKEHAEGAGKAENAGRAKEVLESLAKKIPQIRRLEVGINSIPSDAAYDIAIYSEFADEKDLSLYINHPEHVKVAEFLGKVRENRAVVDYLV